MKNKIYRIVLTLLLLFQSHCIYAKEIKVKYLNDNSNEWITYYQAEPSDENYDDSYSGYHLDLSDCFYDQTMQKWYYNSELVKGWKYTKVNSISGWCFFDEGTMMTNCWYHDTTSGKGIDGSGNDILYTNDNWYYFNENSILVEQGWKQIDNNWYFFIQKHDWENRDRGQLLRNCILEEYGKLYYINDLGVLIKSE